MRAFISLNFPEEIYKPIASIQSNLKRAVHGNFVRPEIVHITLKFLGDVLDSDIKKWVRKINLINFEPFQITLKGLSAFPSEGSARVIFIETDKGREEIMEIEKQLSHDSRFKAHATIARVKKKDTKRLKELFEKYRNEEFGYFTCSKISLMKSTLTSRGPIYEEIQ